MPSYYYHLKFELYATPDPTTGGVHHESSDRTRIWVPQPGATIFDDLPSHPHSRQSPPPLPPSQQWRQQSRYTPPAREERQATVSPASLPSVIDCGTAAHGSTSASTGASGSGNRIYLSERQWRARSTSFPPPEFSAGIGPKTAARDWRFGRINIESFDLVEGEQSGASDQQQQQRRNQQTKMGKMSADQPQERDGQETHAVPAADLGPNLGGMGQATKARYVPLETKNTEAGWGIVHLYREGNENGALALRAMQRGEDEDEGDGDGDGDGDGGEEGSGAAGARAGAGSASDVVPGRDDGTILCIPAVPGYLSPSDFLGFVGEKWRGDVSHYRMVMTSRLNRYMVLMKLRDNKRAREWRKEFDGKAFNSMESEICHVTFIKSITVETPNETNNSSGGKRADNDHFALNSRSSSAAAGVVNSLRPFPPPTPNLIEMPTCPVCLERMDDTTGLMTILCQHVFHCTCLQTWKGSGCPVCRATNSAPDQDAYDPDSPYSQPFGSGGVSNMCSVCDSTDDLWICLVCGKVGCGRYKGGHAKDHWKETAHSFSLELETQHVWDYAGDMWVHRLIRDKGDGKVVELPSNNGQNNSSRRRRRGEGDEREGDEDVVPRAKLDRIGMEYTHLLTSQLESQRIYFDEMVNKAADKAAKASQAAESAAAAARQALDQLAVLREEHRVLKDETVPALEKDLARERNRAAKSTELARSLGKQLQEERQVSEGLMKRIEHLNKEAESVRKVVEELRLENEEVKETNRDLSMFISGQEKLREMESEGVVEAGELEEGTASVPAEERKGGGKGKGRGRKR
ncbi:hypothetical protein B0T22DRAFT_502916 [Podospora appendiculata]|uniref:Uncharacterized protein n=1 Tax=Podospora appendiculata TaxID=314037 RepID=A0AAE0XF08_9PEZI|nr:hypothetical protein B0T22DRAFT_502916 [Podospora appendiculata]